MSEQDAFKDGREQGWRDMQREIERLRTENKKLKAVMAAIGASVQWEGFEDKNKSTP